MKKYISLICAVVMIAALLAGCGQPFDANRDDYWNNTRMDALNYSQYVCKELSMVMNQLDSRMTNGKLIQKNSLAVEDEIEYAETSLKLIDESIDTISKIYPPETYDDDRLDTLACMNDARDSVSQYITYLKSGNTDKIGDYIEDMEFRFSSLSARFNAWTQ